MAKEEKLNVFSVTDLEQELSGSRTAFTTTFDAHQVYLLRQSGFQPLRIVVGVIVYSMGIKGVMRSFLRAFNRGEMHDFSHLNQIAREIAIKRMNDEADLLGADGVIGAVLENREYADFIEVVATGTAVKKISEPIKQEVVVSA